jgi:hypothetical protein
VRRGWLAGLVHGQERDMTNRTYPPGVPCWVDTEQPDVEAATAFYGGIFGWTYEDAMRPGAPGRYVIAKLDGQDVCAIAGPRPGAAAWSTRRGTGRPRRGADRSGGHRVPHLAGEATPRGAGSQPAGCMEFQRSPHE